LFRGIREPAGPRLRHRHRPGDRRFEFEFASTTDDPTVIGAVAQTGSGNLLLHDTGAFFGFQPYWTQPGGGVYQEELISPRSTTRTPG